MLENDFKMFDICLISIISNYNKTSNGIVNFCPRFIFHWRVDFLRTIRQYFHTQWHLDMTWSECWLRTFISVCQKHNRTLFLCRLNCLRPCHNPIGGRVNYLFPTLYKAMYPVRSIQLSLILRSMQVALKSENKHQGGFYFACSKQF